MQRTVAVLIDCVDHLSRGYESELRKAFDAACHALDLNLLLICGRPLEHPDPWSAAHNFVYEIASPDSVDGVVLFTPGLASHAGLPAVRRWAERHRGLPMCSLGLAIDGLPSVTVDERSGMEALVEHIVGVHGCQSVAYIGGPEADPHAQLRFALFREAMLRHGEGPNPELVRHTEFDTAKGGEAVEELVRGGTPFDAVLTTNDRLGIGAIDALREQGLRVPLNVVVTGFDDLAISRVGDPPLTTVRQPLRDMAGAALASVLGQIESRTIPARTILPTELMLRESCGCGFQAQRATSLPPRAVSSRSVDVVQANSKRLRRLLEMNLRGALGMSSERAKLVLSSLQAELSGERYAFLAGLENLQ